MSSAKSKSKAAGECARTHNDPGDHVRQYVAIASAARSSVVDAAALEQALRNNVRGEVRFDSSSRALYATDGSNYRQVPIGVVLPRDADDVIAAVALAASIGAPLLCRGGGTSLAGQCCNVAVVLDFTKYMAQHPGDRSRSGALPGCSPESFSTTSATPPKNIT